MGMFDSVWVQCPECGADIEFQSKAGGCTLANLRLDNASPEVLLDIKGDTGRCPVCRSLVTVEVSVVAAAQAKIIE